MKCIIKFYVYGSVHRWSILIIVQPDATQSSLFIILQVHFTCFGCQPHPSSGVHKTITTASGTCHIFCAATSLQRGQANLVMLEGGSSTAQQALQAVNGFSSWMEVGGHVLDVEVENTHSK